jgi:3-keto-disaccharide hydrolase
MSHEKVFIGTATAVLQAFAGVTALAAEARSWSFDREAVGSAPGNFEFAVTGQKQPGKWVIAKDGDNRVLAQIDRDKTPRRFAMALIKDATHKDLRLSVRAKPIAGDVEMVAGLVWRYKDPDNYYVARWNSDSVRVDRVVNGERQLLTPSEIKATLAEKQWHTLTVEHRGDDIKVLVDGKRVFAGSDKTYVDPGKIGVWIKADSMTYFDDLKVEELR